MKRYAIATKAGIIAIYANCIYSARIRFAQMRYYVKYDDICYY